MKAEEALTIREKQILEAIRSGKTTTEIAQMLTVAENTVSNHRANIMKKLSLKGHNALLKYILKEQ